MTHPLVGTWRLEAWSRLVDGEAAAHPLGLDAVGLLQYAPDGWMMVQMTAANRPAIGGTDPLGGPEAARAAAYASCLAYFGTWTIDGDTVVHRLEASLCPDWTGEAQRRPFTFAGERLVLRTPPATVDGRTTVNEMVWRRVGS